MKNIFVALFLFTAGTLSGQSWIGKSVKTDGLWLGTPYVMVTGINQDSSLTSANNTQLVTADVVKKYSGKLGGRTVSRAAPTSGQVIGWNGVYWEPIDAPTGVTGFISLGKGIPPATSAVGNSGKAYQNLTTGEIWVSDGTYWNPPSLEVDRFTSVQKYAAFARVTKDQAFAFLTSYYATRAGFVLVDTTIAVTANKTISADVRVVRNGIFNISNGVTLTLNGNFQAPPKQRIFNTNSSGSVLYGQNSVKEVYPYWYGAVADEITDCTQFFQKAVDDAIASQVPVVRLFRGYHRQSKGVLVRNPSTSVTLQIIGEKSFDGENGTVIEMVSDSTFAIGIQGGRACGIYNICFRGKGYTYNPTLAQYITNSDATWDTQWGRDSRYSPCAAIVIDPFTNGGVPDGGYPGFSAQYSLAQGFSSNIVIDECVIRWFPVGICFSPTTANGNGSEIKVTNTTIDRCRYGVTTSNTQARAINFIGCDIAGCVVCVDCVTFGNQLGPLPTFSNCQFGTCRDILRCSSTLGDGFITGMYSESVYRIGLWTGAGGVLNLNNCAINFTTDDETGVCDAASVLDAPSTKVLFSGGTLSYSSYRPIEMNVQNAYFEGVYLRTAVINNPNGGTQENRVQYKNCKINGYLAGDQFNYFERSVQGQDLGQVAGHFCLQDQNISYHEIGTNDQNTAVYSQDNNWFKNVVLIDIPAGNVVIDSTARTAVFTTTIPGKYKVGDILCSYDNNSSSTPSGASKASTFGIVTNISGTTITCGHVTRGLTTGSHLIYLYEFKRFVPTCLANITGGSNKVVVTSKPTNTSVATIWPVGTRVANYDGYGPFNYGLYAGLYVTSVVADTIYLSGNVGATINGIEICGADMRCTYYSADNSYPNSSSTYRNVGFRTGDKIEFKSHAYRASATVTSGGFTPGLKFDFKPISGSTGSRPTPEAIDVGLTYLNTTTNTLQVWTGSAWIESGATGSGTVTTASPVSGDGSGGSPITIASGAITATQLATSSVTTTQILNGTIVAADVSAAALDSTVLAVGAVTSARVKNGSLTYADLANSGVTAGTYNTVTVNAQGLVTTGSNAAYLTGNQTVTLTGDVGGAGATSIATTIATGAVTTGKILDGTILPADLANSGVSANTYTLATVTINAQGLVTSASSGTNPVSGTAGRMAYFNAINTVTTDNMYVDATNHRLGIGVASPAKPLDVLGDIQGNGDLYLGSTFKLYDNGGLFLHKSGTFANYFLGTGSGNTSNTGSGNCGFGRNTLANLTTGAGNAAFGDQALFHVTTGSNNVGLGVDAGLGITTASFNMFLGRAAGSAVTTGGESVAIGFNALNGPTTTGGNVAIGYQAMLGGAHVNSTAVGYNAGGTTAAQTNSTALGMYALSGTNSGDNSIGVGYFAGRDAASVRSIFIGEAAGYSNTDNDVLYIDMNSGFASNHSTPLLYGKFTTNRIGIGTNAPAVSLHVAGTDAIRIPGGTTAQRPTGAIGMMRPNTDLGTFEGVYTGTTFKAFLMEGYNPFSLLTGALATNTLDNLNFAQVWNWSTMTSGTALTLGYTGLTNGTGQLELANVLTTGTIHQISTTNNSLNSTLGLLNVANNGTSVSGMLARLQSNSTSGAGLYVRTSGKVGIGTETPAAMLDLPAGTSAAGTAPLKVQQGSNMSTAEAGAVEFNGSWYLTKGSGLRLGIGGTVAVFTDAANNTGTGETDLFSYNSPGNALATIGESLSATYAIALSDVTATNTIKVYFAGTQIFSSGAIAISATGACMLNVVVMRVGSAAATATVSLTTPTASTSVYSSITDLTGLTFSGANILKITGQAGGAGGGSNDITAKLGSVSWTPVSN